MLETIADWSFADWVFWIVAWVAGTVMVGRFSEGIEERWNRRQEVMERQAEALERIVDRLGDKAGWG